MNLEDLKKPIDLNKYEHKYMIFNTEKIFAIDVPTIIERIDETNSWVLVLINPLGSMAMSAMLFKSKEDAAERRDKMAIDSHVREVLTKNILLDFYAILASNEYDDEDLEPKSDKEDLN